MKKFNDEKIEKAIRNATATVEIEGLKTFSEMDEVIRKRLNKEITEEEALGLIKEYSFK